MRKSKGAKNSVEPIDGLDSGSPTYAELVASSIPVGRVPWLADTEERKTVRGKADRSKLEGRALLPPKTTRRS